jgi:hypothetical protein
MTRRIVTEVKAALRQFGTYTFEDRGPGEVMDMASLVNDLKTLHPGDAADVLCAVLAGAEKNKKHGGYLEQFVEAALVDLQDVDDGWWDILLSREELAARF